MTRVRARFLTALKRGDVRSLYRCKRQLRRGFVFSEFRSAAVHVSWYSFRASAKLSLRKDAKTASMCDGTGLPVTRKSDSNVMPAGYLFSAAVARGGGSRRGRGPERGYSVETSRGDAAAATWIFRPRTWIFRGDESRRRRGRDVDILWRPVAATPRPRREYSLETSSGDAAGRDVDIPWRRVAT